jgi:branched-chain amino acid transport system ATP-binding protein
MLEVRDLRVSYGSAEVVHGVDLTLASGQVLGLIGPNGAGKTSILRAICGVRAPSDGRVEIEGRQVAGLAPEQISRLGVALVPEGRQIFRTLTVEENLRIAARGTPEAVEALIDRFPILRERAGQRADRLSGGEQQQLAIARALASRPRILVLDEPSLGLSPKLIDSTYELLGALREEGMTMLLVEQNARRTVEFCDRCVVLGAGRIRAEGSRAELRDEAALVRTYMGGAP